MTDKLSSENKVVGLKQVRRALSNNEVERVYVAEDADKKIFESIMKECKDLGIHTTSVSNMEELGEACGIDISAAVAALLK